MAIRTGSLSIASDDPNSPFVVGLTANRGYYNTEQSCPDTYIGDPVPAGTAFGDTQEAADAAAAELLNCRLQDVHAEDVTAWSGYPEYNELLTSGESISSWSGYPL